jgi:hypothetical protein
MKYVVLATYLKPKVSDVELTDALKFRYPIFLQNGFAAAQLTCIRDALDILKRLEAIESRENQIPLLPHQPRATEDHKGMPITITTTGTGHASKTSMWGKFMYSKDRIIRTGEMTRNFRSSYSQAPRQAPQNRDEPRNLNPTAPEYENRNTNNNGPDNGNRTASEN